VLNDYIKKHIKKYLQQLIKCKSVTRVITSEVIIDAKRTLLLVSVGVLYGNVIFVQRLV